MLDSVLGGLSLVCVALAVVAATVAVITGLNGDWFSAIVLGLVTCVLVDQARRNLRALDPTDPDTGEDR